MATWLVAQGHSVEVITGFPYYPEWKLNPAYSGIKFLSESWEGVRVHRVPHYIPNDGNVTTIRRLLLDFTLFACSLALWAKLIIRKRGALPDIIIAIYPPLASGIWPYVYSKILKTPWIIHIQDLQVDAAIQLGMIEKSFFGRTLYSVENFLLRSATRVSTITEAMSKRIKSKGIKAEKILLLPNWSDTSFIYPINRLTAFRTHLGVADDQVLVMYAGAMGKKQGLTLVLNAAQALLEDARFSFVMIGSGSDADELSSTAHQLGLSNMKFLPVQEKDKLNEVLGSADIHLVVQKADAADLVMPSKLTNILAAGRPSIVTAFPGTQLWEVIMSAETGVVVPPGDVLSFVEALKALAADTARRELMGKNARSYAEKNLEKNAILSRFNQELTQLIGSPLH